MQGMFIGEAHGAMGLMGDTGHNGGCLRRPDLGHRHFKSGPAAATTTGAVRGTGGVFHRRARRRHFACHAGQFLLHRLELANGRAELAAVVSILHRLLQGHFEGAGNLRRPGHGAKSEQAGRINACRQQRRGDNLAIKTQAVTRLGRDVAVRQRHAPGLSRHQGHIRNAIGFAVKASKHRQMLYAAPPGHSRRAARNAITSTVLADGKYLVRTHRGDGEKAQGHIQLGAGKQPARQNAFHQGHRGEVFSGSAEHHLSLGPAAADATLIFRHQNPGQAVLLNGLP